MNTFPPEVRQHGQVGDADKQHGQEQESEAPASPCREMGQASGADIEMKKRHR